MKRNDTCLVCHYTQAQATSEEKPRVSSGPSCESCHGASSDWLPIHNDYGGPAVTRQTEPAAHRQQRLANAKAAGMIHPSMTFDVASNCMACHGLAHPEVDPAAFVKMLSAGHPFQAKFELVQYSQGTLRHRFYPPEMTRNAPMSQPQRARLFVVGHAAKLVSAVNAQKRSGDAAYQAAQKEREADARAALSAVSEIPAVAAFLADPTESKARALADAIAESDLTGQLSCLLPDPSTYK